MTEEELQVLVESVRERAKLVSESRSFDSRSAKFGMQALERVEDFYAKGEAKKARRAARDFEKWYDKILQAREMRGKHAFSPMCGCEKCINIRRHQYGTLGSTSVTEKTEASGYLLPEFESLADLKKDKKDIEPKADFEGIKQLELEFEGMPQSQTDKHSVPGYRQHTVYDYLDEIRRKEEAELRGDVFVPVIVGIKPKYSGIKGAPELPGGSKPGAKKSPIKKPRVQQHKLRGWKKAGGP